MQKNAQKSGKKLPAPKEAPAKKPLHRIRAFVMRHPFLARIYDFIMRHKLIFTILLLLVAWSPYLISAYPGIVTYDQAWSILQFFGSGSLNITTSDPSYLGHFMVDHKPFLFSLIIGSFVKIGGFLGSQNLGLFALVICQSVLMAYVLSLALRKLWRRGLHRFSIGALICLAILPIIPLHLTSPTNDNIFAALFLWWLIILFEIVQNRGQTPLSKSQFIKLLILSILLPLFKKVGIYIILATFVIMLIPKCYKLIKKQVAIIIGAVIASSLIVSYVICPIMDIAPGGKYEAFGIFFHQTSAIATWYPSGVSAEDKAAINEVLDYECISTTYDRISYDPSKRCYQFDTTNGELVGYLAVWARQGLEHPVDYLRSWWGVLKDYTFATGTNGLLGDYVEEGVGVTPIEPSFRAVMAEQDLTSGYVTDVTSQITLSTPEWAASMHQNFKDALLTIFNKTPLKIFFASAVYTTVIPVVCFVIILINKRKWALWLLPILLTMLAVYISPIYCSRYVLPLIVAEPFLIGVAVLAVKGRRKTSHKEQSKRTTLATKIKTNA